MISLDQGQLAALNGIWRLRLNRMLHRRGFVLATIEEIRFDSGFGRDLEIGSKCGQLDIDGVTPGVVVLSAFWPDEKGLHVRLKEIWATR